MKRLFQKLGTGLGFALLASAALAATEDAMATVTQLQGYAVIVFVIAVIVAVYFFRPRDKRATPLEGIFEKHEAIHSVGPDTSVTECVRMMTAEKIGALIVIDGKKLVGIFTERDALNKVLATGLDPISTKVSAVMTKDPCCVPPTTTVGDAMELVTRRRFRHLPIVKDGEVLAVISSGDLTHWLMKDRMGEEEAIVDITARSLSQPAKRARPSVASKGGRSPRGAAKKN